MKRKTKDAETRRVGEASAAHGRCDRSPRNPGTPEFSAARDLTGDNPGPRTMNDYPAASANAPRTPPPAFFELLAAGDGAAAAVLVVWASGRIGSLPVSTPTSPIRSLATCRRARRARTAATFCGALRTGTRTCERPLAVRPSPSVGDCGKPQRLTNVAPQSISVIVL